MEETERANLASAIRTAADTGHHDIARRFPAALWSYFDLRKLELDCLGTLLHRTGDTSGARAAWEQAAAIHDNGGRDPRQQGQYERVLVRSRLMPPFGVKLGAKAARLLARLGRTEIRPGLTEQELSGVEGRFGFAFADDHRAFLATGLPVGGGWPDWRDGDAAQLRSWLDRPVEDVVFAVVEAGFWHPAWGTRPARRADVVAAARAHLASVPQLVPVYTNRYLPAGRTTFAHPVLSLRGADIIPYGYDLIDYVRQEFGGPRDGTGEERQVVDATAAFWADFLSWSNQEG